MYLSYESNYTGRLLALIYNYTQPFCIIISYIALIINPGIFARKVWKWENSCTMPVRIPIMESRIHEGHNEQWWIRHDLPHTKDAKFNTSPSPITLRYRWKILKCNTDTSAMNILCIFPYFTYYFAFRKSTTASRLYWTNSNPFKFQRFLSFCQESQCHYPFVGTRVAI